YTRAHSAGRVLFLLDVSGSMSGDDKLTRAQAAVDRALDLKNPADIVGVQAVPSSPTDPRDPVTLVPFTSGDLDAVRAAVHRTAPLDEGAALYDALASAVGAMRSPGAPARQAIVVLTDGEDLSGGRGLSTRTAESLKGLVAGGPPVPIQVIAFSPASCRDPGLAQVARDSGGQCLADGNLNQAVARAVAGVWGGG
ncbi:MAG: vWA domain-containing protein, partial [Mycobacteriales bacterium]